MEKGEGEGVRIKRSPPADTCARPASSATGERYGVERGVYFGVQGFEDGPGTLGSRLANENHLILSFIGVVYNR